MASMMPFSGTSLPTKQRSSERSSPNGDVGQIQAVVDDGSPGTWYVASGLAGADGHMVTARRRQEGARPGHIHPAVDGRDHGHRRAVAECQAGPIEVAVDDIQPVGVSHHGHQGRGQPRDGVDAGDAGLADGQGHGLDESARHHGIGRREDRDLVAPAIELHRQGVDDTLGAAVADRRHAFERRRHESDAHPLRPG